MRDVRITTTVDRPRQATVEVNGASVGAAVESYTLTQRVGEPPRLTFEVPLVTRAVFDGPAVVVMSDRCAEALVALGWTPPGGEL